MTTESDKPCETCGELLRVWASGRCMDCQEVRDWITDSGCASSGRFFSWLERVIDIRVAKALAERRLP